MPTKKKKVYLEDISFERSDSHVALVGPVVGGPANNQMTLLLKSEQDKEWLEKAAGIGVKLTVEEFIEKLNGFDTEELKAAVGEEIKSLQFMKALDETNYIDSLASLDAKDYLSYLQDQEQLEKAFNKIENQDSKESDNEVIASESDTQHGNEEVTKHSRVEKKVEPSGSDNNKGKKMTQEVDKEMIEKAAAMQAELVELQKAKADMEALVKSLQAEKQEAITKARTDKVKAAVKTDEDTAVFMKAASGLADADFEAFVKSLEKMQAVADQSDLFKSLGADGDAKQPDTEGVEKSLQKRIEAKFNKK